MGLGGYGSWRRTLVTCPHDPVGLFSLSLSPSTSSKEQGRTPFEEDEKYSVYKGTHLNEGIGVGLISRSPPVGLVVLSWPLFFLLIFLHKHFSVPTRIKPFLQPWDRETPNNRTTLRMPLRNVSVITFVCFYLSPASLYLSASHFLFCYPGTNQKTNKKKLTFFSFYVAL